MGNTFIHKYESPLGGITLASNGTALTGLWFDGQKYFGDTLGERYEEKELSVFDESKEWLDIYFSGGIPDFTPPILLDSTIFRNQVWEILLTIPYGETMTYGEIAKKIAQNQGIASMSAQAVGGAVGHNPISLIVPCHRVVGSDGSLTGYAGGVEKKIWLLELEKREKRMIRTATFDDLPRILEIYEYARAFMKRTGNPNQWGNHSPAVELLEKDILKGQLYVYEKEGNIRGVFAFILGEDPTYDVIEDGAWLNDEPYGTLHRVASDGSEHGFLKTCLDFCYTKISHIRIDTHGDNKVMQKAILKNGFKRRGIIYIADGSPRIAYEIQKTE